MKSLYFVLLISIFPFFLKGQDIYFDLISKDIVSVKNNNNFSTRVLVYDNGKIVHDRILSPKKSSTFTYHYSKNTVQRIKYKAIYDDRALEADLNIIESIKKARDRRRAEEAMWKALGSLIDETFFGGTFSTLFEIGNYGSMIFNGATEEEWADALTDSAIGFGINESFDEGYQRGLASGAYELAKSMQSKEYQDLQEWLVFFMKKRESKYIRTGYVTDTAKLPKKKSVRYPYFSVSASYPINQKFREDPLEDGLDSFTTEGETLNDEYPFEIRACYKNKSNFGFFFEYGRTNIFKNPTPSDFQYLKQNNAIRFTTYSLGICPSYSYLEVALGVSYLQQENFLLVATTNQLQPLEGTIKWAGFIEPRINVRLGKPITIFGSWKASVFTDKNIEETWLELYNFKVGIGINFRKKALDFRN